MIIRYILFVFYGLSLAVLSILPYSQDIISFSNDWYYFKIIAVFIFSTQKVPVMSLCISFIFLHTMRSSLFLPRKENIRLKKAFVERIQKELLNDDPAAHRVTLFKEISYPRAVIRNYYYLLLHLVWYQKSRWRWKLYRKWPEVGRYLIVNIRCGQDFKKSSTMFKVETVESKRCTGVAAYIMLSECTAHIHDLPDLTGIDFATNKPLNDFGKKSKSKVKRYMNLGHISNYDDLRKMHKHARHFLGTIIPKNDGAPWGVLLVDSNSDEDPFKAPMIERFNSFATSIAAIIH